MKEKSKLIPSLNGLRAICITMVVLAHLNIYNFIGPNRFKQLTGFILFNGELGVNVFFVISGFLITLLLVKERNKNGHVSLKNFYLRRVIRIFPAYYFLLFVYFVLQLCNYLKFDFWEWFSAITYLKQFFYGKAVELEHLWSLSVEEVFYLVWPFVFIYLNKRLYTVIYILIFFFILFRFFLFRFPTPLLPGTILSTGDALLIGCLFALKLEPLKNWITKTKYLSLIVFSLFLISVFSYHYIFYLSAHSPKVLSLPFRLTQVIAYCFFGNVGIVTNILIGLIVIISINIKNLWHSLLNNPVLNYIGTLSYSIYLWQQVFMGRNTFMHNQSVLLKVCLIFISAFLSYNLIEKPFMKLKMKYQLNG